MTAGRARAHDGCDDGRLDRPSEVGKGVPVSPHHDVPSDSRCVMKVEVYCSLSLYIPTEVTKLVLAVTSYGRFTSDSEQGHKEGIGHNSEALPTVICLCCFLFQCIYRLN